MGHSLQERIDIMLERMELNYGPNRVRRMTKEQFDKMSLLFGVSREEREESHKILKETLNKNKTK
tara:strand:- start:1057 stop:1251 length:195 start_codon:yes stop_codon:yes gene_type:complete